ncbi:hypothetical protein MASR2M117_11090 [Paludibacter sp.]
MLKLPQSTHIGKKIPKEGFYNNLDLSGVIKRAFIDDIEQIIWLNMLSSATLNIDEGEKVVQIDLVRINLKRLDFNKNILEVIEKAIPRHLIFLLCFSNQCCLYVNYKEEYQKGKFKIIDTYQSDWKSEEDIEMTIKGLDTDQVYENLVFQIAGSKVKKEEGIDLKQSVQKSQEIEKIKKKIAELEKKLRKEKQFNIQLKISDEIKALKKDIQKFTYKD